MSDGGAAAAAAAAPATTPKRGKGRALFARVSQKVKNVGSAVKAVKDVARRGKSHSSLAPPAMDSPAEPPKATPRRPRVIRQKSTKLDQQWLDEMSPEFFEPEFNDVDYVLSKTGSLELEELEAFRDRRFQELHAVSRKFSRLVNNNAEQFVQELTRVSELQDQLEYATVLCKKERHKLARADQGVMKGLEVIRKTQRKQVLLEILHAAEEIHGLSRAQTRLSRLLQKDAFKDAIALARESTEKLISYSERGFAVVEDLASELQDTYMQIEEHLDRALATCCRSFSRSMYAEIVESYELLGRPYAAHDRLGTYFVHAIQMSARDIARKHAGIRKFSTSGAGGDLMKMQDAVSTGARQFRNICSKRLKAENYEACLVEVCEAMCSVMVDFDTIAEWHGLRQGPSGETPEEGSATATAVSDTSTGGDGEQVSTDAAEGDGDEAAPAAASAAAVDDGDGDGEGQSHGVHKAKMILDALSDDDPLESLVEVGSSKSGGKAKQEDEQPRGGSRLSVGEYSAMKLEVHRRRLWLDVQRQIGMFLDQVNLAALSLPQYLQLLSHVKRLAAIGEDFSKQPGDILEKSIRENSLTFVRAFHRDMMMSFKAKLAKETWDALHVVDGFNIYLLKEFTFLRKRRGSEKDDEDASPVTLAAFSADRAMFQADRNSLAEADSQQIDADQGTGKRRGSVDKNGSSAEAKSPASGEAAAAEAAAAAPAAASAGGKKSLPPPHCSGTAMLAVRYFGRYLNIMDVLKPVAPEAFQCMTELYSLFLDTAWSFFGAVPPEERKMSKEEKRITKRLYTQELLSANGQMVLEQLKTNKQPREGHENILFELSMEPLELSEHCELTNSSRLNGLEYVTTAMESLIFLKTVLHSMKANFRRRLPVACHNFLRNFMAVFVDSIKELRWLTYKNIVATMLRCDELTKACGSIKWDVKEIMSQHNPYVDKLVAELKIVVQRLDILGARRIPRDVQSELWGEMIQQINWAFLNGFSAAKKCTVEGRAFMQLDYRQYLSKLATLCSVKADSSLVDEWINAFYLPDVEALEEWLTSHAKQHSQAHLASLVHVSSIKIGKKEKQRLIKVLEDVKALPKSPNPQ